MTGAACSWCGATAVTEVIVVKGRANRKTSPVCETHAKEFERRGLMTVRLEVETRMAAQRRANSWRKGRWA